MENEFEQNQKLDLILSELDQIKKHLNIVPDKFIKIQDIKSSLINYEQYARSELKLTDNTINNHKP